MCRWPGQPGVGNYVTGSWPLVTPCIKRAGNVKRKSTNGEVTKGRYKQWSDKWKIQTLKWQREDSNVEVTKGRYKVTREDTNAEVTKGKIQKVTWQREDIDVSNAEQAQIKVTANYWKLTDCHFLYSIFITVDIFCVTISVKRFAYHVTSHTSRHIV